MEQDVINAITKYLRTYRIDDDTFLEQAREIYQEINPIIVKYSKWSDAPEWAKYRTEEEGNKITFWENKPRQPIGGIFIQGFEGGRVCEVVSRASFDARE